MSLLGSKKSAQFAYWNLKRKGQRQSEIARQYGITRQAVSKSIKLMERDILYQMLEFCRTSGVLVEWTDAGKGVTIGILPQLGGVVCILLIDNSGSMRMFYDPDRVTDKEERDRIVGELRYTIMDIMEMDIGLANQIKVIVKKIVEFKGKDGRERRVR